MNDLNSNNKKGTLYVVATPIGNMGDITLRAIQILGDVGIIAAEDTRRTGRLLAFHEIKKRLVSYQEHNEYQRSKTLIERLNDGVSVALVSDAGTPAISDPGYLLIRTAIESGIKVVPIPGVSAAMTALSVSGLPTDAFVFIGFPERKKAKRLSQLKALSEDHRTLIFYESPKRIANLVEEVLNIMGDRYGVFSREMTKLHEEFIRDDLSEIANHLRMRSSLKGECTLLVSGHKEDPDENIAAAFKEVEAALMKKESGLSGIVKKIASTYGLPKNRVYQEALRIKNRNR